MYTLPYDCGPNAWKIRSDPAEELPSLVESIIWGNDIDIKQGLTNIIRAPDGSGCELEATSSTLMGFNEETVVCDW
jgi:hypothetical protein